MPGTPSGFKDWLQQALGQGDGQGARLPTLGGEAQWRDGPFRLPDNVDVDSTRPRLAAPSDVGPTLQTAKRYVIDPRYRPVLDQIAAGEGTGEDMARAYHYPSGYDIPNGYGSYGAPPKPLTQMTIAEVKRYQNGLRTPSRYDGLAVGRYQIKPDTIDDMQRFLRNDPAHPPVPEDTDLFSSEAQDALGAAILKSIGLHDDPGLSADIQARAADRWTSIENPDPKRARRRRIGTTTTQFQNVVAPFWVGK